MKPSPIHSIFEELNVCVKLKCLKLNQAGLYWAPLCLLHNDIKQETGSQCPIDHPILRQQVNKGNTALF